MIDTNEQKKRAAEAAIKHIETDQVVGIGSGTTVEIFIKLLKKRILSEKIKITTVPTSYQSEFLLMQEKIPITSLNEYPELDIAVDGADEIDPTLNLIKGGGGALTQEKIIDSNAKLFIVISDDSKRVQHLGQKMPVPLEVMPVAVKSVMRRLTRFSSQFSIREAVRKMGPVVTDNGNFIIDVSISDIKNPKRLEMELNNIPGIVENGLFIDMAHIVYYGTIDGVIEKTR